jgi:uncharacterized BrkB/YihY/UPF0761 family membrane protein
MAILGMIFAFALMGILTLSLALVIDRVFMRSMVARPARARAYSIGLAALILTILWVMMWRIVPNYPEPWPRVLANALVIFSFCCGGAALFNFRGLRRLRAHDRPPRDVDIFA